MDDLIAFLGIIGGLVILIGSIILGAIAIEWNINSVPVKCWVDNELVYDGRSACINVESGGRTTIVNVKGGWYCQFPKAHYVSDNVKLEGSKI